MMGDANSSLRPPARWIAENVDYHEFDNPLQRCAKSRSMGSIVCTVAVYEGHPGASPGAHQGFGRLTGGLLCSRRWAQA
eukprot:1162005-Pelagomonas_calceolata.AAC.6